MREGNLHNPLPVCLFFMSIFDVLEPQCYIYPSTFLCQQKSHRLLQLFKQSVGQKRSFESTNPQFVLCLSWSQQQFYNTMAPPSTGLHQGAIFKPVYFCHVVFLKVSASLSADCTFNTWANHSNASLHMLFAHYVECTKTVQSISWNLHDFSSQSTWMTQTQTVLTWFIGQKNMSTKHISFVFHIAST